LRGKTDDAAEKVKAHKETIKIADKRERKKVRSDKCHIKHSNENSRY